MSIEKVIVFLNDKRIYQISFLIFVLNIIVLVYIFGISFHSRLLGDDLVINSDIKKFTSFQYVSHVYNTWTGRFTAVFIQYYFFSLYNQFNSVLLNVFILYFFGFFTIFKFLKFFFPFLSQFYILNFSFFILNILILSSLEIYTIFWVTTHVYYFNIFILFLLFSLIFKTIRNKLDLFLIILLSFYIGGIGEHISPIYFIFILYLFYSRLFSRNIKNNLILSLFFCTLSFLILLLAPGNLVRISYSLPSNSVSLFQNSIFVILKMIVFVSFKSFYFLVLFFVFYFLGYFVKKKDILLLDLGIFPINFNFKNRLITILVFILVFILIQLPAVFAISNSLPRWSSLHLNFMIILFVIYYSFNSGYYSVFKYHKFKFLITKVFLIFLIFIVSYFFYKEYYIVKTFSYKYDNKLILLNNMDSCITKYNSIFSDVLEVSIGKNNIDELQIFLNDVIFVPKTINSSNENKYFDFFLYRSPFYCH